MCVCVCCVAVCARYTITQRGGAHSTVTHGIIYIYACMYTTVQCSMAGHQWTVGIPAGGGRADTPAGSGQVGIPAGATLRMDIHSRAVGEGGH
jgi:hypothetical protein